jgi:ELWxxDGT repeat protein
MKTKLIIVATLLLFNNGFAQTPVLLKNMTTVSLDNSYPRYFTEYKGKTIFTSSSDSCRDEVYITDGTSIGTKILADIGDKNETSFPSGYHLYKDKIYFCAQSKSRDGLWVTDGTTAGTTKIKEIGINGGFELTSKSFVEFKDKLYFISHDFEMDPKGIELWVTDGTSVGTKMVKDINDGFRNSNPKFLTVYKDKLYFAADNGTDGEELWVSDGTESGTTIFKDINIGLWNSSSPSNHFVFKDQLYFQAYEPSSGFEWWVTDGTLSGTKIFKDINPGIGSGSKFAESPVIIFKDKFYFSANEGVNGYELWSSDGTEMGTEIVKDINSFGNAHPGNFCEYNGKFYFQADDGINGKELWVSDGTTVGTKLFLDLNGGKDGSPFLPIVYDSLLYFIANVSSLDPPSKDLQLWVTDGDVSNTKMISAVGATAKSPLGNSRELTVCNNMLFMQARFENTIGLEPYIINTVPLKTKSAVSSISNIELYPNPTTEIVYLEHPAGIKSIKISNTWGNCLYKSDYNGEKFVEISLKNYPSGIYTLSIFSDQDFVTKKIVKQ